mmetsp:Transcript_39319/g.76336  ORF Transcript_39319/g.76336 Transcript_39319/m.76336 type:complete len:250 (+) Transcript_39319:622-1371(+)
MVLVFLIVRVKKGVLGSDNTTSRLQNTVKLLERCKSISGVKSGFEIVDGIKCVIRNGDLVEVTLDEVTVFDPFASVVPLRPDNVFRGNVDPGNAHPVLEKFSNCTHGATNSTSHVKNTRHLSLLCRENIPGSRNVKLRSNIVLIATDRCVEVLAFVARCKMERFSPSILVEVGDKVVECRGRLRVFLTALVRCCILRRFLVDELLLKFFYGIIQIIYMAVAEHWQVWINYGQCVECRRDKGSIDHSGKG